MSHMQPQITERERWLRIETINGLVSIPWDHVSKQTQDIADAVNNGIAQTDETLLGIADDILPFTDVNAICHINSISDEWGYGARMSAPGYLDCTEWAVFDTEQEAAQYLLDTYSAEFGDRFDWEAELEELASKS